jgi:tetratricopeptide (TPR) repeat protein
MISKVKSYPLGIGGTEASNMNLIKLSALNIFAVLSIILFSPISSSASGSYLVDKPRMEKNAADYLVISPAAFLNALDPLLEKRVSEGLRVAVVTPESIHKEFKRWPAGSKAIRAFVRYAYFNWEKPAPKYLLLVGDTDVAVSYDPAGVSIPTFMVNISDFSGKPYTGSDAPYSDMDGDEIPDISIGRLPVDTPEELKAIVLKIIAYETSPPPGLWKRRVSVFASTGDFGIFDSTLEELTKRMFRSSFNPEFDVNMTYAGSALPYFLAPEEFDSKVVERFNEGALIMSYIGHGDVGGLSNVCWRGDCRSIMEVKDVQRVASGGKNAFFFSISCLTGKFNILHDCIAEELLKSPGGPVGVFAASEVSHPYANALISKDLLFFLTMKKPDTIGQAILNIQRAMIRRYDEDRRFVDKQFTLIMGKEELKSNAYDHLYIYNFLGDPATRIAYPKGIVSIQAPKSATAGGSFSVSVDSAGVPSGKTILTLEAHPTEMIYPTTGIEGLEGDALKAAARTNYSNANNKVAFSLEISLDASGEAVAIIEVPGFLPAGKYYIKAYAWNDNSDASGVLEIDIESENPAIKTVAATVAFPTELERLSAILNSVSEPSVSSEEIAKAKKKADPHKEFYENVKALESQKGSARGLDGRKQFLKDIISSGSANAETYFALHMLMLKTGETEEAESALEMAEMKASPDHPAHIEALRYYRNRKYDYRRSEEKARRITESMEGVFWPEATRILAELELRKDRNNPAASISIMWKYHKLIGSSWPKEMAIAEVGSMIAMQRGFSQRAEMYYDIASGLAPQCADCRSLNWSRLSAATAIRRCAEAVKADPDHVQGYLCLGKNYHDTDMWEKSSENYAIARKLKPGLPPESEEIYSLYKSAGKEAALKLVSEAENAAVNEGRSPAENKAIALMKMFARLEDYDAAQNIYKSYVSGEHESSAAHLCMASTFAAKAEYILKNADKKRGLAASWNEQTDVKASDPAVEAVAAYELAAALTRKALTSQEECEECLRALGDYNMKTGQYGDAEEAYAEAAALAPRDGILIRKMAQAMLKRGKRAQAEEYFYKSFDLRPEPRNPEDAMKEFINPEVNFD